MNAVLGQRRGLRLRTRIVGFLLLVGIATFMAFVLLVQPKLIASVDQILVRETQQELEIVADSLLPLLIQNQFAGIHENLDELRRRQPPWRRLELRAEGGRRLYPLRNEPVPTTPNIERFNYNIDFRDSTLASLEVHVDFTEDRARIQALAMTILLIFAGVFSIALLLVAVFLDLAVGRRARALSLAADRLAHRDFDAVLPGAGSDEIGDLVRSFAAMRDAVRNYEASLYDARVAAEAANRAKSDFLSMMSHEIRTPMNGVLGMAQLLLAPSVGTEDRLDFARTIFNSGQTLLALLNDILDLSKVESGKFELEASVFEPEQIVHETLSLFAEAARSKGLRLEELSAGRSVARYRGDARRLRQMLANLVGNAIKFTAQGHVRVAVTEIGRGVEAAELEFSVSDTGPGVSPDQLGLLFKPFTQADSSNTRQFGGTGLGLSIVRSLSRLMGGDAGVDSQTGRGSRFWFRIRASVVATDENSRGVARRVQTRKPTPAGSPSAFSGHVLVAEDNPVNRKVIELMLTRLGLTVTCVGDGRQCVEAVRQGEAADLIFMDIQMPVLDGYQATRQIREWEVQQGGARRPIVALSAGAFESDRQQALAAGMDDFLTKPVIVEALSSALRHFLPVRGALLSEVTSSEAPAKDLDGQRFVTLVEEIVPLLSRQKFDAFSRYKDLQAMAAGSALSLEIDEIGTILAAFQFDLARERLLNLAEKHAWKLET